MVKHGILVPRKRPTYLRTEVRGDPQGLGLDIYVRDYINVIHQLVIHDPIRGNEVKYAYK